VTFGEHSFQDDEDPGFAESPSVRAAKAGDAKSRSQLSKKKNTAISMRLAKAGESSQRSNGSGLNGVNQSDESARDGMINEPSTNAGPSRRPRTSAAGRPKRVASPTVDEFFGDDTNDQPFVDNDMGAASEPVQDSADEDDEVSARRSSNRTKVVNAREEASTVKQTRGRRGKQKSPASVHSSTDAFETMPEAEALPERTQPVTKAKRGRPPGIKKPVRARKPSPAKHGDGADPVRRTRNASQAPEERIERVDEGKSNLV
jgi:hypothetical protein